MTDRLLVMDHGGLRMRRYSPRGVPPGRRSCQPIGLASPPGDPGIVCAFGSWGYQWTPACTPWSRPPGAAPPEGREGLMLKDITLGQFFPGKTVTHQAGPPHEASHDGVYTWWPCLCANSWVSYGLVLALSDYSRISVSHPAEDSVAGNETHCDHCGSDGGSQPLLHRWGSCAGPVLGHYHYLGGSPDGDFYGFPNHHAHYRHLPADLYHLSHCPD